MSEIVKRLDILKQYLADIRDYAGGLIEATDAVNYVRWNFHRAVTVTFREADQERQIQRQFVAADNLPGEPTLIESTVVTLPLHRVDAILASPTGLSLWYHKNLISPVLAEENRVLKYSTTKRIQAVAGVRSHFDRVAQDFRFKVWETVHFPDAEAVPPRVPPPPKENPRYMNE